MSKLTYILILGGFCFPLSADEVDLDHKIQNQFVVSESQIEQHKERIEQHEEYINELFEDLRGATISNDDHRLKNILFTLNIQLQGMQDSLSAYDAKIETYRVSLAKASKHIQKEQFHREEPSSDELPITIPALIWDEMSEEDKRMIGSLIPHIVREEEEQKRMDDIIEKIPVPDRAESIKIKHTLVALKRLRIHKNMSYYKRLQSKVVNTVERYMLGEFASESTIDHKKYLDILNDLIDSLPEPPSENPYSKDTVQ